eukprot:157561-Prymnesium_polylepis.1
MTQFLAILCFDDARCNHPQLADDLGSESQLRNPNDDYELGKTTRREGQRLDRTRGRFGGPRESKARHWVFRQGPFHRPAQLVHRFRTTCMYRSRE